jgi:hypothetical protein
MNFSAAFNRSISNCFSVFSGCARVAFTRHASSRAEHLQCACGRPPRPPSVSLSANQRKQTRTRPAMRAPLPPRPRSSRSQLRNPQPLSRPLPKVRVAGTHDAHRAAQKRRYIHSDAGPDNERTTRAPLSIVTVVVAALAYLALLGAAHYPRAAAQQRTVRRRRKEREGRHGQQQHRESGQSRRHPQSEG